MIPRWLCPVSPLSSEESAAADLFGPDDGFVEEAAQSRDIEGSGELRVDDAEVAEGPEVAQRPRGMITAIYGIAVTKICLQSLLQDCIPPEPYWRFLVM